MLYAVCTDTDCNYNNNIESLAIQSSSQPAIHAVRDECTNGDWMEKSWNGVVSGEKKRKRLKTFLTMSFIGDKLKYTEKNNAEQNKLF